MKHLTLQSHTPRKTHKAFRLRYTVEENRLVMFCVMFCIIHCMTHCALKEHVVQHATLKSDRCRSSHCGCSPTSTLIELLYTHQEAADVGKQRHLKIAHLQRLARRGPIHCRQHFGARIHWAVPCSDDTTLCLQFCCVCVAWNDYDVMWCLLAENLQASSSNTNAGICAILQLCVL